MVIRFFTEGNTDTNHESLMHGDMVLSPPDVAGGYWNSMPRFLFQIKWFRERYRFDYFLRIDDDGFLCLDSVMRDLEHAPTHHFFWGKYFCLQGKVVADENFMLFSQDLIEFFLSSALRINEKATFAAHFGLWQHMMDLQVLDDRGRIHAQQGWLKHAKYMQDGKNVKDFCQNHIWSHHVRHENVFSQVFALSKARNHSSPNTALRASWIKESLGKVCVEKPKVDGKKHIQKECLGTTKPTSLQTQIGNRASFHGSSGFPSICSNENYSCRTRM